MPYYEMFLKATLQKKKLKPKPKTQHLKEMLVYCTFQFKSEFYKSNSQCNDSICKKLGKFTVTWSIF